MSHFRLRVLSLPKGDFCEPPIADPHDGWCGEGWLNTAPYPIRSYLSLGPKWNLGLLDVDEVVLVL